MESVPRKKIWTITTILVCVGAVVWQLYNSFSLILTQPTKIDLELVPSTEIPLSFSLCSTDYDNSDDYFDDYYENYLEKLTLFDGEIAHELVKDSKLEFEYFTYVDKLMMCQEFDLTKYRKTKIAIVRKIGDPNYKNLHLYFHPPGMFYLRQNGLLYSDTKFNPQDAYGPNEFAKISLQSYDFLADPNLKCSVASHQECIHREIINIFNSTMGCTFPIQR